MAPRQTTPEGEAILAAELAATNGTPPPSDPAPKDAPFEGASEGEPAKPRRGRPPGSKNVGGSGRRSRASKLDEIQAAADTAVQRACLLASYAVLQAPIAPDRKIVWMQDAEIVGRPQGRAALTGSLRFACERNARIERLCLRMIEASAYTGIGAAVVFGLVLPIAMNHGLLKGVPPQLLAMLQDEDGEPFADAPANAGESPE